MVKNKGFTLIGTLIAMLVIAILALAVLGILSNQNFLITLMKSKYEKESEAMERIALWFLAESTATETAADEIIDGVPMKLLKRDINRSNEKLSPKIVIRFEAD